jgi:hypothetical protein
MASVPTARSGAGRGRRDPEAERDELNQYLSGTARAALHNGADDATLNNQQDSRTSPAERHP